METATVIGALRLAIVIVLDLGTPSVNSRTSHQSLIHQSSDPYVNAGPDDEPEARNTGSNLFVTGIHPKLSEGEVAALFEKYGEVEKCNIMRDPHSKESRGFGFVNMITGEAADAAKEGLQGQFHEGRTLSIEKARRSKPRTPTPGKYFGPPKCKTPF